MMALEHRSPTAEANPQSPTNTPDSRARRAALKKMIVATGVASGVALLPKRWAKPVVDRALVPAHAQTSPPPATTSAPDPGPPPDTTPAPTTTPCDIVGTYCYSNDDFNMQITVETDGAVNIVTSSTDFGEGYWGNGSGSVLPTGGSFNITTAGGEISITVTGTVVCNSDSISGEITDEEYGGSYTATTGQCAPSDIRLKTDIKPLGRSRNGFKLYRYRYIDDASRQPYVGVMAQDLTTTHPHALVKNQQGYFAVRYDLLGLRRVTYAQWQQAGLTSVELPH
jgi:hypothetical protein